VNSKAITEIVLLELFNVVVGRSASRISGHVIAITIGRDLGHSAGSVRTLTFATS
jgi:hypothetical protein